MAGSDARPWLASGNELPLARNTGNAIRALEHPVGFSIPDFQQSLQREATQRLTALIPADARSWCRPEALVTSGKAQREIVRVAKENQAELIVMGVQSRGAIDLLLFGSTTHHVIREGGVPVLTLGATVQ